MNALGHSEAEEGLYFNSLVAVHEDEERPVVLGGQEEVLEALCQLIQEGIACSDDPSEGVIFSLRGQTVKGNLP